MGPSGMSVRVLAGYLAGISLGTMSVTLLFLGMRAVMDVGGACADGGPYVSAQPCPTGTPLAMIGGMFGLFGSAGLILWFGSQIGRGAASLVALGWPALFLALGFNFVDYAFQPPDGEATPVWGWLIPGILFWLMGGVPLLVGIWGWRAARGYRAAARVERESTAASRPIVFGGAASPARATTPAPAPTGAGTATAAGPGASSDLVDDLTRLAELHDAGDLTDDEFAVAKRELLADFEERP